MSKCKGCGAEIIWVKTRMEKQCRVIRKKMTIIAVDGEVVAGRIPHWMSCTKANQFRK